MIPTYSIIIPHKNIPDLLQRCLDSIPLRDDVQVIVVDDNSDSDKVDFEHFPGHNRLNTEVYFDKTGKGAGHARNIGLEHSKGKWLLFADADDFFTKELSEFLEENVDNEHDIIYFLPTSNVFNYGIAESPRVRNIQELFSKHIDHVRFSYVTPWGKIIKRQYVENNKIRFEETKWSNDVLFSVKTAFNTNSIEIVNKYLYVVVEREGSLTKGEYGREELSCRTKQDILACNYAIRKGSSIISTGVYWRFYTIISRREYLLFVKFYSTIPRECKIQIEERILSQHSFISKVVYSTLKIISYILNAKRKQI